MPSAIEFIAKATVGSGGSSLITFDNIPQTYTDLLIKVSARSDVGNGSYLAAIFNNSSSTFDSVVLYHSNTTVSGYKGSGADKQYAGYINISTSTADIFSNSEIYILNYTGSTNKSFSSDAGAENNGNGTSERGLGTGLWSTTSAISRIDFDIFDAGSFVQHTTAYLYGITNA